MKNFFRFFLAQKRGLKTPGETAVADVPEIKRLIRALLTPSGVILVTTESPGGTVRTMHFRSYPAAMQAARTAQAERLRVVMWERDFSPFVTPLEAMLRLRRAA